MPSVSRKRTNSFCPMTMIFHQSFSRETLEMGIPIEYSREAAMGHGGKTGTVQSSWLPTATSLRDDYRVPGLGKA